MKTLLTLVVLIFSVNEAMAKGTPLEKPAPVRWGDQCGFANPFEDSPSAEVVTIEAGAPLTLLQTRQVIQAAQTLAAPWDQEKPAATLEASIAWLVDASEGGEVYLKDAATGGVAYTYLEFYPGGNPVGVIFVKGTLKDVAHIEDSDIVCTD